MNASAASATYDFLRRLRFTEPILGSILIEAGLPAACAPAPSEAASPRSNATAANYRPSATLDRARLSSRSTQVSVVSDRATIIPSTVGRGAGPAYYIATDDPERTSAEQTP